MVATISFDRQYKPWVACDTPDKHNTRPALSGVYVDPKGLLVAADGFILTAIPCTIEGDLPDRNVIVPVGVMKAAAKRAAKRKDAAQFSIDFDMASADGLTRPLIEGQYPDYWRIIPREYPDVPPGAVSLNPKLLAKMQDALGATGLCLHHATALGPYVAYANGGLGVIMGMRSPVYNTPADVTNFIDRYDPAPSEVDVADAKDVAA